MFTAENAYDLKRIADALEIQNELVKVRQLQLDVLLKEWKLMLSNLFPQQRKENGE